MTIPFETNPAITRRLSMIPKLLAAKYIQATAPILFYYENSEYRLVNLETK